MESEIVFRYDTGGIENRLHVGGRDRKDDIILRTKCPFCNVRAGFRQIDKGKESDEMGDMVALHCDSCMSIVSCNISNKTIYPQPSVSGLDNELPSNIKEYYDEALRCIEANAPNGAATVFRKVIDAVCIYYDVTNIDDDDSFYDMIEKLAEEGYITESLRQSLLGVKDGGRDGAHINDRDPTIEEAINMKQMIDSVLTATVVADQKLKQFRADHPNPYTKEADGPDG